MKLRNIKIYILLTPLFLLLLNLNLFSQEADKDMMEEYTRLATPGPQHEMLKKLEGEWEQTYYWYTSPDGEPMISKGIGNMKMILGGRFLQWDSKGEAMGQIVENLFLVGHDNRFGVFNFYGFDTMGTYAVSAEGKHDEENNTIVFKGKNYEMMINDYIDYTMNWKFLNDDEFGFDVVFDMPEKGEMKIVEVKAKRVE